LPRDGAVLYSGFAGTRDLWKGRIMILGLSIADFTLVHVVISLMGIVAGLVVLAELVAGKRLDGWNAVFLLATVATSASGFLFPFASFGPSQVVGAISLVALAVAVIARYGRGLGSFRRAIYAAAAMVALYLNVFVGVAQAFRKLPFLQPLAPTQSEPPFLVTQLVVLAAFLFLCLLAVRRLGRRGRPQPSSSDITP
jgi:hypothetical protein